MVMVGRRPKAADIHDAVMIAAVHAAQYTRTPPWATRWDVAKQFPWMPFKVVSAKLNSMVRRGILRGCSACHNCRGDFEIVEPLS